LNSDVGGSGATLEAPGEVDEDCRSEVEREAGKVLDGPEVRVEFVGTEFGHGREVIVPEVREVG
jgi:hypothetical protein